MDLTYHVRKTWDDSTSQVGIDYKFLINAKKACDKLTGYNVYDSNGVQVYPEIIIKKKDEVQTMNFNIGDAVQILSGATYVDNSPVPASWREEKLVIKSIQEDGYVLARGRKGAPIGPAIPKEFIAEYCEIVPATIDPFYISVKVDKAEIHATPSKDSKIIKEIPKFSFFRIVNEQNGWGKLGVGAGWINLNDGDIIKR